MPGIATDLLHGLAALGHRIDCFFPARRFELPARVSDVTEPDVRLGQEPLAVGPLVQPHEADRVPQLAARARVASLRLRRELVRRHGREPYDVFYQFSNVENLAVPRRLRRGVPLVVHPGQSSADALRFLLRERSLSFQGRPA